MECSFPLLPTHHSDLSRARPSKLPLKPLVIFLQTIGDLIEERYLLSFGELGLQSGTPRSRVALNLQFALNIVSIEGRIHRLAGLRNKHRCCIVVAVKFQVLTDELIDEHILWRLLRLSFRIVGIQSSEYLSTDLRLNLI